MGHDTMLWKIDILAILVHVVGPGHAVTDVMVMSVLTDSSGRLCLRIAVVFYDIDVDWHNTQGLYLEEKVRGFVCIITNLCHYFNGSPSLHRQAQIRG